MGSDGVDGDDGCFPRMTLEVSALLQLGPPGELPLFAVEGDLVSDGTSRLTVSTSEYWTPLAELYADVRHLRFADGPDEVHYMVVGRDELARH